jgi:hypothetical protein
MHQCIFFLISLDILLLIELNQPNVISALMMLTAEGRSETDTRYGEYHYLNSFQKSLKI